MQHHRLKLKKRETIFLLEVIMDASCSNELGANGKLLFSALAGRISS